MFDIVFPEGNEKEFIGLAKRLGYTGLVFVYSDKCSVKKIAADIPVKCAVLCSPAGVRSVRDSGFLAFCRGSADARGAIERSADLVFGVEDERKDSLHYRRSGLNQVLCGLAHDNGVKFGFDFNCVLRSRQRARAVIVGRMRQNIRLCRKYRVKPVIASFARSPFEMRSSGLLRAFFHVLGMQQGESKSAFLE